MVGGLGIGRETPLSTRMLQTLQTNGSQPAARKKIASLYLEVVSDIFFLLVSNCTFALPIQNVYVLGSALKASSHTFTY